jgi:hypothetical protein
VSLVTLFNPDRMPKWAKFILAVLLLPVCIGGARALWRVLKHTHGAELAWVPLLAGAACWLVVYLLLPKPMMLYVFGHELTHVVWTWIFGGSVTKFKVSGRGGHVVVTKHNFLIALAPYFFPLYAVLTMLAFGVGHAFWNWSRFLPWFHLILGAAYSFHLTLTWHILQTRQSDITGEGYLFSAVVIFLGNVIVLLIGVPLLTGVELLASFGWWFQSTGEVLLRLARVFQ